MEAAQKTPEIPAHWFSNKDEMHEMLEEWMMAWIATKQYDGMSVQALQQQFVLYNCLQQQIRSITLV